MNRSFEKILKEKGTVKDFDDGSELYRTGYIAILIEGRGEIFRNSKTGEKVSVRKIKPGDIFGAASLFGEWDGLLSSVLARGPCKLSYLSEDEVRCLLETNPDFTAEYIYFLSSRIRFLNSRLDVYSSSSSAGRLYEYLTEISDEEGNAEIEENMAELSKKLKIGRSSLYRSIDLLEENKLIKREKNKFYIL